MILLSTIYTNYMNVITFFSKKQNVAFLIHAFWNISFLMFLNCSRLFRNIFYSFKKLLKTRLDGDKMPCKLFLAKA